ncbi:MAG: HEAT repeat domain-containing protein [Deltaproteobacteria bacterium]|nr:HEAT repeat domain-containing protein [Deltaproteobacteria bacterium]MBT6434587.1 HEAT repeat domain-containing protein [Deltaproteobacteria bacterium]MBT6489042.1 HEAT repeat domain-containing protein [Deltaproteobacteria bacterium]
MKLLWLLTLTFGVPNSLANDPVQVLNQLSHASPAIRAQAAQSYGKGCRDRKLRRPFRRERSAPAAFKKASMDSDAKVRKASVEMAICFGPEKSAHDLQTLIHDGDPQVSLAAMTQLAHFEHSSGVGPLVKWLSAQREKCLGTEEKLRERCVFSAYAIGQAAQHGPADSLYKRQAVEALIPLLESAHPKTREVSAVALSFTGDSREVPVLSKLLVAEERGRFDPANPDEVLEHFKALIAKLKMVSSK